MPEYSLGEIMSLATARVGRRADIPASDVSLHVNMAYAEVAQAVPHALLECIAHASVTSGDQRITLPDDFNEPISFQLKTLSSQTTPAAVASYKTLHMLSPHEADGSFDGLGGEPQSAVLFRNWIELHPSPNSAFSLSMRYRTLASDILSADSVPSLSTPWRPAVLYKTETLLHEYLGNYQAAAAAQQRYLSFVNQLKTDEARRQSSKHRMTIAPVYPQVRYR